MNIIYIVLMSIVPQSDVQKIKFIKWHCLINNIIKWLKHFHDLTHFDREV